MKSFISKWWPVWVGVFLVGVFYGTFARAHGPQIGSGCPNMRLFMPVHCHRLNDFGCCSTWVYDHPPPTQSPSYPVEGEGEDCSLNRAAHKAYDDAESKCGGELDNLSWQVGGIYTPSCPVEAHDDVGLSGNGRYDVVTLNAVCKL